MYFFYPRTAPKVMPWLLFAPSMMVWLIGRAGSNHIGSSGLIFAMLGFVLLSGLLRRDARSLSLTLAVAFYYGGMLGGIVPQDPHISWEFHLSGLLIGMFFAVRYRHLDHLPRKHYDWEDEEEPAALGVAPATTSGQSGEQAPPTVH